MGWANVAFLLISALYVIWDKCRQEKKGAL